jgi:glycosyl transferase family 11
MIIIKLIGGLGNQMFQYACAFALAKRINTDFALDLCHFKSAGSRKFSLQQWNITKNQKLLSTLLTSYLFSYGPSFSNQRRIRHRLVGILLSQILTIKYSKWKFICEKQFGHFQNLSSLIKEERGIFLSGYWQSEKYFVDIEKSILRIFTPSQNLSLEDQILSKGMRNNRGSVSVHIRCGDYLHNLDTWKLHYVCTPGYYQEAFNLIEGKIYPRKPHLYIFSDDPQWVKGHIEIPYGHTFVSNRERIEAHEITLMSKCHHHIIANSTFSWWGAWLNRDPKKVVIAPPRWSNDSNTTPDIIPKEWMKSPNYEYGDRDHIATFKPT